MPSGNKEIHVHAAAFYVALIRGLEFDAAAEFAEWYLETFDHDLEDEYDGAELGAED